MRFNSVPINGVAFDATPAETQVEIDVSISEGADALSAETASHVIATVVAAETGDTTTGQFLVDVTVDAACVESADSAVASVSAHVIASASALEIADEMVASALVYISADASAVEAPDSLIATGQVEGDSFEPFTLAAGASKRRRRHEEDEALLLALF